MYEDNDSKSAAPENGQRAGATIDREIFTVSELNEQARRLLERSFPEVWLEGEVSRPTLAASGHAYFTLKDENAAISCACFKTQLRRSRCKPESGIRVLARGRVSLYPAQGRYQFIVSYMEDAGEGALQRAYEALKRKLSEEGLFDTEHKKPLPVLPRRVGLITSETGAVIHDMITTFHKRFPAIALRLYPVTVQGRSAVAEIVTAIEIAQRRADCDALILARGGGSLEDLVAFNDEKVARAVFNCSLPIVCGVGHEPDVSIADFVADYRAATPTAAAEALSPDRYEWLAHLRGYQLRLINLTRDRINADAQRIDLTRKRLVHPKTRVRELKLRLREQQLRLRRQLRRDMVRRQDNIANLQRRLSATAPDRKLQSRKAELKRLTANLTRRTQHNIEQGRQRYQSVTSRLHTVSPLATLERGYAIIRKPASEGHEVVRDAAAVDQGEGVEARLAKGELKLTVTKTNR